MTFRTRHTTSKADKLKKLGLSSGGSAEKAVHKHEAKMHPGAKPTKFASGGKVKAPNINISIKMERAQAPEVEEPMEDMGSAEMAAPLPPPPMPMEEPMMPPPADLGAVGGLPAGAPSGSMAGSSSMVPPMFKRGGTVGKGVTTAGAGGGMGRLQKIGKSGRVVR